MPGSSQIIQVTQLVAALAVAVILDASWNARLFVHCDDANVTAVEQPADSELIRLKCKQKLKFDTIKEFREFAELLRRNEPSTKGGQAEQSKALSLGNLLNLAASAAKDEQKCLQEREAIYALDELVANYDRKRPCKMSEVAKMEQFAVKYLLNNTKSIVLRFFTLFGVNIGIKCKLNLLAHLKQADSEADQLDFIYSMASPTGWTVLINEHAKKSMKFGSSSHTDGQLINRIARLVPGLSQVEHLDYLSFDHPLNDKARFEEILNEHEGSERDNYKLEFGSKWRSKLISSLNQIIESCKNLDQFYVNSVLSLARLKELGLLVEYLGDIHEHSVVLHKWLSAASFCQLMVRVDVISKLDTTTSNSNNEMLDIEVSILHDDERFTRKTRLRLYSYAAEFDEIDPEARERVWCASIPDGEWRRKGEAMFVQPTKSSGESTAMRRLKQFIKGLERTYEGDDKKSLSEQPK